MSTRVDPDVESLQPDDHMLVCSPDTEMDRFARPGFFAADAVAKLGAAAGLSDKLDRRTPPLSDLEGITSTTSLQAQQMFPSNSEVSGGF